MLTRLLLSGFVGLLTAAASGGCAASVPDAAEVADNTDTAAPDQPDVGSAPPDPPPTVDDTLDGIPDGDDLANPGTPALKQSYLLGLEDSQGPADHFDFDDVSHWVRTSSLHGTEFSVALDRSVLAPGDGPSADAFADYVQSCFHAAWHVFGGYAFDRYAVRVRADDGNDDFSLSAVGITLSASDYAAPWGLEVLAHEMFHSWNGKFIRPQPDESDDLFQWETWIVEGATVYYSFRHMGFPLGLGEFQEGMSHRLDTYQSYLGTPSDLSISELAAAVGATAGGDPATQAPTEMLYARSALVAYMIDLDLAADGQSLDDVLRELYLDALDGRAWTRARLEEILLAVSARDFQPFLSDWLDTNAQLPVTAPFELRE